VNSYHLSDRALADLEEIWDFLARNSGPGARRMATDVLEALGLLAASPLTGHPRDDIPPDALAWRVRHWLIVYRPADGSPVVLRILYGGRDLRRVDFD
jgi:toxin ParE1/3/4